jgi:hypothetical protein
MMSLQELVINRAFIKELLPLITLTKALAWDSIGSVMLKKVNLVNVLKIHGKEALKNKQVLNALYSQVIMLKDQSTAHTL